MTVDNHVDAGLVAPGLFVGSFPKPGRYRWVSAIVLCAREHQPSSGDYPNVIVIRMPIDDNPWRPLRPSDAALVTSSARTITRFLRSGQRVLVTCAMGLNRSALVAGLVMRMTYGIDGNEAIARVRAARGALAFGNPVFRRFVRNFKV